MAWVKLHTDIIGDEKLLRACRKGAKHLHWLPWLIAFAKRADDDGRLTVNGEPLEPVDIAHLIPCATPDAISACLVELEAIGVLVRNADGVLAFLQWEHRSGAKPSDDPEAIRERVRKHRANRKRAKGNASGNALQGVSSNATEEEEDTEAEAERDADSSSSSAPANDTMPDWRQVEAIATPRDELIHDLGGGHAVTAIVDAFLARIPDPASVPGWIARVRNHYGEGIYSRLPGGIRVEPRHVLDAMDAFTLKGAAFEPELWKGYVARVARGEQLPRSRASPSGSVTPIADRPTKIPISA